MTTEKIFTGVLILDWKTKNMRIVKKPPKKYKPFEIPIKINIKVKIPQIKEYELKGNIEVHENKVTDMIIEEL